MSSGNKIRGLGVHHSFRQEREGHLLTHPRDCQHLLQTGDGGVTLDALLSVMPPILAIAGTVVLHSIRFHP